MNVRKTALVLGAMIAIVIAVPQLIGCGDNAVLLQSIAVSPSPANGTVGGATVGFTATGTFTDGSTSTTIPGLTWSSGDTNTATIDATTGVATCVAGNITPVTITATAPTITGATQTVTGTSQLTCNAAP